MLTLKHHGIELLNPLSLRQITLSLRWPHYERTHDSLAFTDGSELEFDELLLRVASRHRSCGFLRGFVLSPRAYLGKSHESCPFRSQASFVASWNLQAFHASV